LWQLDAVQKSTVAKTVAEAVGGAYTNGLITQQGAMKELRQVSRSTGVFTNITADEIQQAEDELSMPGAEDAEPTDPSPDTLAQHEHESTQADLDREHDLKKTKLTQQHDMKKTSLTLKAKAQEAKNAARSNRQAGQVGGGARKRVRL
jgi:hypothetical protein